MSDDIKALYEWMRQFVKDKNIQFVTARAPRNDTYTEEEMNQFFDGATNSNFIKIALQELVDKGRFSSLLEAFTAARNTPDFFKRQLLENLHPYNPSSEQPLMIVDSCTDIADMPVHSVDFIEGAEYLTVRRGKHKHSSSGSPNVEVTMDTRLGTLRDVFDQDTPEIEGRVKLADFLGEQIKGRKQKKQDLFNSMEQNLREVKELPPPTQDNKKE